MKKGSSSTFRERLRVGGLVAVITLLGALTFGPSAFSADSKTYSAVFTSTAPGGENGHSMSLTLENLGSPQLGAANITAPAGIVIQSVTGLNATSSFTATSISLRDLNLASGTPVTFPMTVNVSCPARNATWVIVGKQNNNGTGSTFTLAPSPPSNVVTAVSQDCTLGITVQPNHAEAGQIITNTAYDPAGSKVTVQARNNDGDLPLAASADTVTLGKTAGLFTSNGTGFTGNALPLSGGEVTFSNLKSDRTGLGFRLTATATGYTSSLASNSFDIQVDGTTCPGASCHVETPRGHTTNKVDGAGTASIDTLGVGLLGYGVADGLQIPDNVCSVGPFVPLPDSSGFTTSMQLGVSGSTTSQPDYTLAATLDKFIMNQIPLNGAAQIEGCLGAKRIGSDGLPIDCTSEPPTSGFPTKGGGTATCDAATGAWWGLVPDAGPGIITCTDSRLTNPVILSRNKSGSKPGDFTITMCKPYPWDGGGGWR
jgi:hypothetical protein